MHQQGMNIIHARDSGQNGGKSAARPLCRQRFKKSQQTYDHVHDAAAVVRAAVNLER